MEEIVETDEYFNETDIGISKTSLECMLSQTADVSCSQ